MTPEDEEFERIEREAKMKPPNISFNMTNPMPKAVMTLSCEGIWVDPSLSVDEAARTVLAAIDGQIKYMVDEVRRAEREACARVADLVAREIDDTNGTATYIATAIRSQP
jgi:hypothetical protein